MADHVRQQIRTAIANALVGLPTTGTRVFTSRVAPIQQSELPALLVIASAETAERTVTATINENPTLERTLIVTIVGTAKATANVDNTLDAICSEVEVALTWPVSGLRTLACDLTLETTDSQIALGEQNTGRVELTYTCTYFTLANDPTTAIT